MRTSTIICTFLFLVTLAFSALVHCEDAEPMQIRRAQESLLSTNPDMDVPSFAPAVEPVLPERSAIVPLKKVPADVRIKGQYIVVLKKTASSENTDEIISNLASNYVARKRVSGFAARAAFSTRVASLNRGKIQHVFQGLSGRLSSDDLRLLRQNPNIEFIEEDAVVNITASQASPTWGLDRLDQANLPLNNNYEYGYTGAGVNVYVIDSGIRITHTEFEGRASNAFSSIGQNDFNDCNGHGTHVAGTIGSKAYGVAKGVKLHSVRVLDCQGSGSSSGLISGIDFVRGNAVKPAVASMSVGGGAYQALDNAIANLVNSGIAAVVAAGNDNKDACNYSPARAPLAITVGATSKNDARASFSNWGTCVDIFGPGDQILSLGTSSNSATATMSGTSMATPHVSGVVAQYLESNPSATPAQIASYLTSIAVSGKVTNPGSGSPNKLLQTVPAGSSPAPTNSAAPQPTSSAAPPVPVPAPVPCTSCSKYSGNLRWTADFSVQPNGNYYRTTATSTHRAWLSVASENANNVDFDLVLYKAVDGKWKEVSASRSVGNDERIVYTGDAGYYYFSVISTKGSGPFDLYVQV